MSAAYGAVFITLLLFGDLGTPIILVLGWRRWIKRRRLETLPSILSFVGLVVATGSAALGVITIAYAQVHHFRFYDPSLMKIMKWGVSLSLAAMVFAITGLLGRSSLRWLAPSSAVGTLIFWVMAAEGE
jgi:hypothetical protein